MWELERRGYLQSGVFTPEVVLDHPERVISLHEEFVHAGSDIVEAFTVRFSPSVLYFPYSCLPFCPLCMFQETRQRRLEEMNYSSIQAHDHLHDGNCCLRILSTSHDSLPSRQGSFRGKIFFSICCFVFFDFLCVFLSVVF